MAVEKIKSLPKIKTMCYVKPLVLYAMMMLLFFASACSGSNGTQTGPTDARIPTGEYLEFDCSGCGVSRRFPFFETQVISTDYIGKYADTLDAMFANEWTLLSTEKVYEPFDRDYFIKSYLCHLADQYGRLVRSTLFYRWTVEYRHSNGNVRQFVFDNRPRYRGFACQVGEYMRTYIREYYSERFLATYMEDFPLVHTSSFNIFFASWSRSNDYEAFRAWRNTSDAYHRQLKTPEGAMHLSQLTPANVFEIAPIMFSFHISVDEYSGIDPEAFKAYVMARVETMIDSLNQFTNNQLRATINLRFHDASQQRWHYIQGERIFPDPSLDFGWYVLESYRGMFWE